ncbi:MAG: iron-only hydrogenase system regulator [Clostridia bacterium]|nr:iron-only hydrogenase system regulator [Clostridia bacterium]
MNGLKEEKRLAVLSVIVEDRSVTDKLNGYLTEYADCVVGRMGIPYREKGVSVLSVVLDAPPSVLNALTGKIGMLKGVTAKTLFSKY